LKALKYSHWRAAQLTFLLVNDDRLFHLFKGKLTIPPGSNKSAGGGGR